MEESASLASQLCQACGLCCTGHLFAWTKLRPAELNPSENLGLTVFKEDPTQRGFSQPCPLWQGVCSIYTQKEYPHACKNYKCKLLKELIKEETDLTSALELINQSKSLINEVKGLLPESQNPNFRERLVAELEQPSGLIANQKEVELLKVYEQVFGVDDLVEKC